MDRFIKVENMYECAIIVLNALLPCLLKKSNKVCETDVDNISKNRQRKTIMTWILVKRSHRKGVDVRKVGEVNEI
jgi:hypothetical protein